MSAVIFKMSFQHRNKPNTKARNIAHLNYIATRPGVDKSITKEELIKELKESDNIQYSKYINERPNSHGLFGQDGIENLKDIQYELSNTKSYVWRTIISLREEDAKELGYLNKDQWQILLRNKLPDIGLKMGIDLTNLRWAGAVHMEKGHPHAHIMIWEKTEKKTTATIPKKNLEDIRKMLTDEVFKEKKMLLIQEKNNIRNMLTNTAKQDINSLVNMIKEIENKAQKIKNITNNHIPGIAPKLYKEEEIKLINMIKDVSSKVPSKGRADFKLMPPETKIEIEKITSFLLNQNEFKQLIKNQSIIVEELTNLHTVNKETIEKAKHNMYNDIHMRINNIILKEIRKYNLETNKFSNKQITSTTNGIWKKVFNEIERQKAQIEFESNQNIKNEIKNASCQGKKAKKENYLKSKNIGLFTEDELQR